MQETTKVRKRIALASFTLLSEERKHVQRWGRQSGSSSRSRGPQNGFVAAGGHDNLLDTGACLEGNVLQDVLHDTRTDVVADTHVDPFQVIRGHVNEHESYIFVPRTLQTRSD
jgi:hypothetical protein